MLRPIADGPYHGFHFEDRDGVLCELIENPMGGVVIGPHGFSPVPSKVYLTQEQLTEILPTLAYYAAYGHLPDTQLTREEFGNALQGG